MRLATTIAAAWLLAAHASVPNESLGGFERQSDVGLVKPAGSARFDAARKEYELTAGGENMWGERDAFHFLWRRASGDLSLSADDNTARRGEIGRAHV